MIAISRRLAGLIPYTVFYFPTSETVRTYAERMPRIAMARLFLTSLDLAGGRCVVAHHLATTVLIDLTNELELLHREIRNPNYRRQIARAVELGDRVQVAPNDARAWADFLPLFNDFARVRGTVEQLSRQRLEGYREAGEAFVIYLDGQPMCGHLTLPDSQSGRVRLQLSCSRRLEGLEVSAMSGVLNRYLIWWEIAHYKARCFSSYDLGGITDRPDDGIARFKKGFGGRVVLEHSYLCAGVKWLGEVVQRAFEFTSARANQMRKVETNRSSCVERC